MDAGDSFDGALGINTGITCDSSLSTSLDNQDWYHFYTPYASPISIYFTSGPEISLYSPSGKLEAHWDSCSPLCQFTSNSDGPWRLKVFSSSWSGVYTFSVFVGTGGGGGSVLAGSLVTMADGSKIPIQNLVVGDRVQGYNRTSGEIVTVGILETHQVTVDNLVIIRLVDGTVVRTDNNPLQMFWVKKASDFSIGMVGVPSIQPGDYMFNVPLREWVQVVSIDRIFHGQFTMYDLNTDSPDMGYVIEDILDPVECKKCKL